MRLLIFWALTIALFGQHIVSANECSDRCTANYDRAEEAACNGSCDFYQLETFNKQGFSNNCKGLCAKNYHEKNLVTACLAGCDYGVSIPSNSIVKAVKTAWKSIKNASSWVMNKSKSFLDKFFTHRPNQETTSDRIMNDAAMQPHVTKHKPALKAVNEARGGGAVLKPKQPTDTIWVTRIRWFFLGPKVEDKHIERQRISFKSGDRDSRRGSFGMGHFSNPLDLFAPAAGNDGIPPPPPQSSSDFLGYQRWLQQHHVGMRPLFVVVLISSLGLVLLSLTALCLLVKIVHRRRRMAATGGTIYTVLPKYDELMNSKKNTPKEEILEVTSDTAPLTV